MTRDALLLARELYAGDPTWDARDERCSQPLAQPTAPVWGCLLTPEQALHAVQAGVPLCDVPHWLRTDALEQAALDADIANLAHLAPARSRPRWPSAPCCTPTAASSAMCPQSCSRQRCAWHRPRPTG